MTSKDASEEEEEVEGGLELEKYVSNGMEKTISHFSELVKELNKDEDCNPIATYVVLSAFKKFYADVLIKTKVLDSKEIGRLGVISIQLGTEMYQEFVKDFT